MPLKQALFICAVYIFGGVISDFLMKSGVVEYPFYVYTPPGADELRFILIQSFVFCSVIFVGRRFISENVQYKSPYLEKYSLFISNHSSLVLVFLSVLSVCLTVYYWDRIVAETATRHSGNQLVLRLTLLVVLGGGIVFHNATYSIKILAFTLLIYVGTISGSIESSRVVALPFIVASFSFLRKKNYLTSVFFLYLTIIAIRSAFAARSDPSYFNYWSFFVEAMISINIIDHLVVIIQYSFPGLTTVQISMIAPGDFSFSNLIRFLLYISPIPSSVLPDSLFEGSSLSGSLGIDRSLLGINQDIYSEGVYWFGVGAAWIYTFSLAALVLLPYCVASRIKTLSRSNIYLACFIANIWMIVGGQVFTLRAGSRAVMALVILMIIFSFLRRFRIKRQSRVGGC